MAIKIVLHAEIVLDEDEFGSWVDNFEQSSEAVICFLEEDSIDFVVDVLEKVGGIRGLIKDVSWTFESPENKGLRLIK